MPTEPASAAGASSGAGAGVAVGSPPGNVIMLCTFVALLVIDCWHLFRELFPLHV
jgi:hypothetical protein